jgi:hypothetical protein
MARMVVAVVVLTVGLNVMAYLATATGAYDTFEISRSRVVSAMVVAHLAWWVAYPPRKRGEDDGDDG